jgi:hypothetical protein
MRTYVSVKRITSIFRVETQPGNKPMCSKWLHRINCHLGYQIYMIWGGKRTGIVPAVIGLLLFLVWLTG